MVAYLTHTRFGSLLVGVLLPFGAYALRPELKYPVNAIPAPLLADAACVVRLYELNVVLEKPSAYTYHVRRVVTLLGPGAAEAALEAVRYSKLQKVSDLEARVYDFSGKKTRDLSAAEWRDVSATSSGTFADDERARLVDLRQPNYPYTVEFAYTVRSQNPLFLPRWQPQQDWRESVEQASLTVSHPATLRVRWREQAMPPTCRRDSTAGAPTQRRWTLTDVRASAPEDFGPDLDAVAASVWLAPTSFEVQGYAGAQNTWADLGRWTYALNANRDALPPEIEARMVRLRTTEPDLYRRARRVYDFVQRTTRYISIQYGLGGWQTIPAAEVARTGYGDCKALTNYCRALLTAAGLPAWCALVRAGDDEPDIETGFVASQFNHVVLCLPLKADTVWLECTSQSQPFGFAGAFTANRHALLLTPEGGRLVRTSRFAATANQRTRRTSLQLDDTGNGIASVRTRRTGLLADGYAGVLSSPPDQQRRYVTEQLNLGGTFTLERLNFTHFLDSAGGVCQPTVVENLQLRLASAGTRSGARLLFQPNQLAQWSSLTASAERRLPLWLDQSTSLADTVVIRLPAGAKVESLPPLADISTPFGTYRAQLTAAPDGTLTYVRRLQTQVGRFPASDYAAYADFRRRIAKADRAQAVVLLP